LRVSKIPKARILLSVLIIGIFVILFAPPNDTQIITTETEYDVLSSDDINMDQEIIDQAFETYSIIDTEIVFTESNDSLVTRFLDEQQIDSPFSTEKFGIETQTVLFDSNQEQFPSSNILDIPQLTLTDTEGRILDLGSIQTSFVGITANSEKSFNMTGTVEFWLDDTLIKTKKLYASDTSSENIHPISVVDSLPPSSFDRPTTFTFTLSDEGRNWTDGSEHTYRVVMKNIDADVNSEQDHKKFSWSGEEIVYELKTIVDDRKITILDEENNAVAIFKSDNTLQICGNSIYQLVRFVNSDLHQPTFTVSPIPVTITDVDGNVIASASFTQPDAERLHSPSKKTKNVWYGTNDLKSCSEKVSGIPRNADLIFIIDGQKIPIKTPLSQVNYYESVNWNHGDKKKTCSQLEYHPEWGTGCEYIFYTYSFSSNFNYP
jgi:hypothetical protein